MLGATYEVLVAVGENDERGRRQGAAVATLPGSGTVRATLLHVFRQNREASASEVSAVRRAAEVLEGAGVEVQYAEDSGDPADSILAAADRTDADLLCLASRKRSPAGKAVFGSVFQGVFHGTDRPVMVVGADAGGFLQGTGGEQGGGDADGGRGGTGSESDDAGGEERPGERWQNVVQGRDGRHPEPRSRQGRGQS